MSLKINATMMADQTISLDDRMIYYPKGIIDINSNILWNQGYEGDGIKVGVIDSGIFKHPDLGNRVVYSRNFTNSKTIGQAHGTHVAGTIGANGRIKGVMPKCLFYSFQILDQNGDGNNSDFSLAIDDAIKMNVDIINMSIGSQSSDILISNSVKKAYNAGIIMIAAAGNEGSNTVLYPGALDQVVSVGNYNGSTNLINGSSSTNRYVDCCAPGTNILSLGLGPNQYLIYSGTSMATPHVTGICGLYLEMSRKINPGYNRYQHRDYVMYMLYSNVIDKGPQGRDDIYGKGLVRYQPGTTPYIKNEGTSYYSYFSRR